MLKPTAAIEYVFVSEQFRGQGIGTHLVEAAASVARQKEKPALKARTIVQDPFGGIYARMLEKAGFMPTDTASLVRFSDNPKTRQAWAEFMETRGRRICKKLEERGYRTISFAEADAELMQRFGEAVKTSFPFHLDPFLFLNNRDQRPVREFSFLTLKGEQPAAYSIVTTVDGKPMSFQQLSAAFQYQGSGAFLLPIAAFVEKWFNTAHPYTLVSAMIYDNNHSMARLIQGFLQPLPVNINTQRFYVLPLQEPQEGHCEHCGHHASCPHTHGPEHSVLRTCRE